MSSRKLNDNTFSTNSAYITLHRGCKSLVNPASATTVPQCNKQRCKRSVQQSNHVTTGETK